MEPLSQDKVKLVVSPNVLGVKTANLMYVRCEHRFADYYGRPMK